MKEIILVLGMFERMCLIITITSTAGPIVGRELTETQKIIWLICALLYPIIGAIKDFCNVDAD